MAHINSIKIVTQNQDILFCTLNWYKVYGSLYLFSSRLDHLAWFEKKGMNYSTISHQFLYEIFSLTNSIQEMKIIDLT